jgi:hypothetical protein
MMTCRLRDNRGEIAKTQVIVIVMNNSSRTSIPNISIYPNPPVSTITPGITSNVMGRTSVVFYNAKGIVVHKEKFIKTNTSQEQIFDVPGCPKVYM